MKKLVYGAVCVIALGALWFAYYAISPLFIGIKVDEALPGADQPLTDTTPVIGTVGHPASGTARIVDAEGRRYVRYENFKTLNGPDLFVYLAKDLDAKEFVDLGVLRATEGNVNYEIPQGVDLTEYRYVLTWCKQFGVLFNYADLSGLE